MFDKFLVEIQMSHEVLVTCKTREKDSDDEKRNEMMQ